MSNSRQDTTEQSLLSRNYDRIGSVLRTGCVALTATWGGTVLANYFEADAIGKDASTLVGRIGDVAMIGAAAIALTAQHLQRHHEQADMQPGGTGPMVTEDLG